MAQNLMVWLIERRGVLEERAAQLRRWPPRYGAGYWKCSACWLPAQLPERRLESYRKLMRENQWMVAKTDARLHSEMRKGWKADEGHPPPHAGAQARRPPALTLPSDADAEATDLSNGGGETRRS